MRYSRRYVVLTILLVATFLAKVNTWNDEYADVAAFRGAQLQDTVFYPLKARSINEAGLLTLVTTDQTLGTDDGVIVGDHMLAMISLPAAQKLFGCSAHIYEEQKILLDYEGVSYVFYVNSVEATRDGQSLTLDGVPELHEGEGYLPLQDLCREFGYTYHYDSETYQATITEEITQAALPMSYDLRDYDRAPEVRNQGSTATCWAQAALSALESALLPKEACRLDATRMIDDNAYQVDASLGGNYTMASSYMLSWTGPVTEKGEQVAHVQEVHFYGSDDIDEIKRAVYESGAVSTSIYAKVSTSNITESSYYNRSHNAYCYRGDEEPNHDVVIIGWDDSYGAANFNGNVPGGGAFICQNSWGATFGEKGVFYVSYYDTNIGDQAVSYCGIEDTDNYDTIYQSDLCGWVGQVGYNKEKIHAANVYTATEDEQIAAVGFYALGKNTDYQLYVVDQFMGTASLANRVSAGSGSLSDAGFYTIKLDTPFQVDKGDSFAVIVVLTTPGLDHPMAIEYASDELTANVDVSDGEGYISNNGLDWERVEDTAGGNLCLKAYGITQADEEKEQ